jgi:large subunit ribosomal protein L18
VRGSAERPRLCVFRSLRYLYVQVIDDDAGHTVAAASSMDPAVVDGPGSRKSVEVARKVGLAIAERAKAKGIETVVFDRGGYPYHGRVKALAEGAREGGLRF